MQPERDYTPLIERHTEMENYKKVFKEATGIKYWDSKKYEIHHIDRDRENNNIRNLLLVPKKLHTKIHALQCKLCGYTDIINIDRLDIFIVREEINEYINCKEDLHYLYSALLTTLVMKNSRYYLSALSKIEAKHG